jgi:hypothetical protein
MLLNGETQDNKRSLLKIYTLFNCPNVRVFIGGFNFLVMKNTKISMGGLYYL